MLTNFSVSIGRLLVVALWLVGCATTYHPENNTGGYSEIQLDPGVWKVTFRGNTDTPIRLVEQYAQRRAGEVCRQHGFSGFRIIDDEVGGESVVMGNIQTGIMTLRKPEVRYKIQCE